MKGSPAVVALADAHAAAMNLANVEQRGLQAVNRVNQASEMTKYEGKMKYNNLMQSAYMGQYASDIRRATIINQGNMDYYQNALKSYTAQQQATSALIGGISEGISAGASAYGGDLGSIFGGGGSTATATASAGSGNILSNYPAGSAFRGGT